MAPPNTPTAPGAFDFKQLHEESKRPQQFVWPAEDVVKTSEEELNVPIIDLEAIKNGDEAALASAAELVRESGIKHGFFQVTNHGVDPNLINAACDEMDSIFHKLTVEQKMSAKLNGFGYSGAHATRFSSKLPWKECFTFIYNHHHQTDSQIVDFFTTVLGQDFQRVGLVYQKYCEAMKELSGVILELLAVSLSVDRLHYRKFFEDAESMLRFNFYPPSTGGLAEGILGTGPHCDPTSVTLLYQDQVGGLEIFVDNKWLAVRPNPNNFVINIGDTFKALTNGIYKSCLHRVLANPKVERKTLAFFINPKGDKTVKPPNSILGKEEPRNYPDFTWNQFFKFTQTQEDRSDHTTLQRFVPWLQLESSKPSN